MKEDYGDIWYLAEEYDAVVITTNGYVRKDGKAVMGRGIAKEATEKYPNIDRWLGYNLKKYGNRVFLLPRPWEQNGTLPLFTFPVKPEYGPNGEMGWKAKADIELIAKSAHELVGMINGYHFHNIILPRPGCGNGGLKWEDVKPVIEPILDDRFTVVTWHP